ncbi:MAG: lysine--tRNA ligase [Candidatus Rehaiarchaeum fermentans]|nr:lysine--tRNA ligase [Candidatus Rehaiarchaeum fermentans]MCW1311306.1 lysine--tRNA ligase [Candidatus Rehaiarchaeum fermentans]
MKFDEDRLKKLEEIKKLGLDPFGHKFEALDNSYILNHFEELKDKEIRAKGRIMSIRDHGEIIFIDIKDDTGTLQLYIHKNKLDEISLKLLNLIERGDIIGAIGKVELTKRGTKSLSPTHIEILSKCLLPFPSSWFGIQDIETRYRKRYLDFIFNDEAKEKIKIASKIVKIIREILDEEGYIEVVTPILQEVYGGANALPFKTHYNALDQDYFLRISPELYLKRLLVGGFEKIYEFAKNFRNEGIDTKHNPEFTGFELYKAYGDLEDMKEITKKIFQTVSKKLYNSYKINYIDQQIDLSNFKEETMENLVKKYTGKDNEEEIIKEGEKITNKKLSYGEALNAIFEEKIEKTLIQPTFVTKYPVEISPLTKVYPDDKRFVQRFELYIAGMEFANAYTELNDPLEQIERFKEEEKKRNKGELESMPNDEDFIEALGYGMPPTGGLGIGMERLFMLFTNSKSIRDVIAFPQLRSKNE